MTTTIRPLTTKAGFFILAERAELKAAEVRAFNLACEAEARRMYPDCTKGQMRDAWENVSDNGYGANNTSDAAKAVFLESIKGYFLASW